MRLLRYGCRGPDVTEWQGFLASCRLLQDPADGVFGKLTREATERFQGNRGLVRDGVVGPATRRAASPWTFSSEKETAPAPSTATGPSNGFYPPAPTFKPLGPEGRARLFGAFDYRPAPTADNPERIEVLGDWAARNLVVVDIPELRGIPAGERPSSGRVLFHRLGAAPLRALFREWGRANLVSRLLTYDGSYVARFVRRSRSVLSPHAHGTAVDFNAPDNPLGAPPARSGSRGSVVELVEIANEHGFYWGGHFSRRDGMHFELARLP